MLFLFSYLTIKYTFYILGYLNRFMIYNKKDLKNTIKTAFKRALTLKTEVLLSYTFTTDTNLDNIKSNILSDDEMFYICLPNKENHFIGKGNLIKSGHNKSIDISQYTVISNLKDNNEDFFTFNISAFDLHRNTNHPWMGIPRNKFIIPFFC